MIRFCLIIILSSFLSSSYYAQIHFKINFEPGIHFNLNDSTKTKPNALFRIAGILKYKQKNINSITNLSLKIRPEIFNANIGSLKINPTGTFLYFSKNIIWKSFLSLQHNSYFLFKNNSYYNTFTFINGAELGSNSVSPINISLGYSYQNIVFNKTVNSDFLFLDIETTKQIDNYFSWGYGIFVQNFTTKTQLENKDKLTKSNGWMYGPQLKLHYAKKFIVNADYKFLLENSNFISYPSYEHQIKLLAGFIINRKFSLFLLADYFIRRITLKQKAQNSDYFLYKPTKNENQLFIKTSYNVGDNSSLYVKTGYFSENLFLNNFNIEGINIFVGYEYKN